MKARQVSIIAVIIVLAIAATCSMASAAEILASQNLGQSAYTASSSYSAGFAPYLAFDGNAGTMWNAGADGGWLEVNLGRVCDLTRISLLCYQPAGTLENMVWYSMAPIGNGYADGFACSFSGTGTTYTSDLIGIQTQYVQVQTTLPSGWTNWYEVQIFATAATLTGTIRSTESGNPPVEGATVATRDGAFSTTTGADGTYSLAVPGSPSLYSFVIKKDGYISTSVNDIQLLPDDTVSRDLAITPVSAVTLQGTVRSNELGSPTMADITVETQDGRYIANTDSNGHYEMALPAGTYTIIATKDGYKDFTSQVTIVSGAAPITLDITLLSKALVTVSGTVRGTEPGNPPLAGAIISTKDAVYTTTTAANGTYSMLVPRTTTALLATSTNHVIGLLDIVTGENDVLAGQDFLLELGLLVSKGRPASAYSASATYDTYGPALAFDGSFANASRWVSPNTASWIEVDLGGSYLISKVLLSACMAPASNTTDELRVSDVPIRDLATGATLVETFSGLTEDLSFKVKDFVPNMTGRYVQVKTTASTSWNSWYEIQVYGALCTVSGTVKSTEKGLSSVAGVTVATPDGAYSAVTDGNGAYTMIVPAGNSNLVATKDGYLPCARPVSTQANDAATVNFDLITSAAVTSLQGTVRKNDNGFPVADGAIVATSDHGYVAMTNSDGLYKLALPAGSYTIVVKEPGYKDFSQQVTITNPAQPKTLDITLISTSLLSIRGTVRGTEPGNPPLAGATIITKDALFTTTTAADGTYRLAVPRNTTNLLATHPKHVIGLIDVAGGDNDEITGQDFTLELGLLVSKGRPASAYSASATYTTWGPDLAFDGSFANASRWVAPGAKHWIEVDLGGSYLISKVLLSACMVPASDTTEELRVSDSPIRDLATGATLAETFSGITEDLSFKVKDFVPNMTGRYVQVKTTASNSWTSWYEVQVYGALCTVSGTVKSTQKGLSSVAGATVATPDGAYSTVTDGSGAYTIIVPAGNLTLVASKTGFTRASVSIVAQANDVVTANFDLKDGKIASKISDLKGTPDGTEVMFTSPLAVVAGSTTFRDGSYYLEETDRSAGIKVVPTNGVGAVNAGDRAIFSGILATDAATGERFLSLVSITDDVAGDAIRPLGMTNKAITGGGVTPSALLVTTWGKVTYVDPSGSFMYIDDGSNANDGSGHAGIKVILDAANDLGLSTAAQEGDNVTVTGIVRFNKVTGTFIPEILPRSAMEIINNQFERVVVHQSDFAAIGDTSGKPWRMEIRGDGVHAPEATATFVNDGILCKFPNASDWWIRFQCRNYDGMPLSELTNLKFSELMSVMPALAPSRTIMVMLRVDTTGDGVCDEQLAYEPYYHQETPFAGIPGTWQVWDAFNNGLWSRVVNGDFSGTREAPAPLSSYITPESKLQSVPGEGAITFAAADYANSQCAGFIGTLGNVTIGTTTTGTTVYSFAPDPAAP